MLNYRRGLEQHGPVGANGHDFWTNLGDKCRSTLNRVCVPVHVAIDFAHELSESYLK